MSYSFFQWSQINLQPDKLACSWWLYWLLTLCTWYCLLNLSQTKQADSTTNMAYELYNNVLQISRSLLNNSTSTLLKKGRPCQESFSINDGSLMLPSTSASPQFTLQTMVVTLICPNLITNLANMIYT